MEMFCVLFVNNYRKYTVNMAKNLCACLHAMSMEFILSHLLCLFVSIHEVEVTPKMCIANMKTFHAHACVHIIIRV